MRSAFSEDFFGKMNIPQPYTVPMTIQELGDFFNTLTDPLPYVVSALFLEKITKGKIGTTNPQFFDSVRSVNL